MLEFKSLVLGWYWIDKPTGTCSEAYLHAPCMRYRPQQTTVQVEKSRVFTAVKGKKKCTASKVLCQNEKASQQKQKQQKRGKDDTGEIYLQRR